DLTANLLVRDGVLRRAVIANDLHGAPSWNGHDILGACVANRKHLSSLIPLTRRHTEPWLLAERVADDDRLGPPRPHRDQRTVDAHQRLDAPHVLLRRGRQLAEVAHLARVGVPALQLLVDRLRAIDLTRIGRQLLARLAIDGVADADAHAPE